MLDQGGGGGGRGGSIPERLFDGTGSDLIEGPKGILIGGGADFLKGIKGVGNLRADQRSYWGFLRSDRRSRKKTAGPIKRVKGCRLVREKGGAKS